MIADGMNEQPSQTTEPDASPSIHQDDGCDTPMPIQLPLNFSCLACGYDLSNSPIHRCPECGRDVTLDELDLFKERAKFLARERLIWNRSFVAAIVVIACSTVGFLLLSKLDIEAASVAALASGILLLGQLFLGFLITRLAQRPPMFDRRLFMLVWIRAAWWVNGPWLIAPVIALVLILTSWIDGKLMGPLAALGIVPWIIWCFYCITRASQEIGLSHLKLQLDRAPRGKSVVTLLALLAVFVWILAGWVGFACGATVVVFMDELFRAI